MEKHPVRLCCLIVSALLSIATAEAQNQHTLNGKVLLPNGAQPPNPVRVTLTYNGRHIYETFTDLSGRFSFSALGRGIYQLTAEGDENFETTRVSAEISAYGSAPQTFTQNIQLHPKKGGAIQPAGVTSIEALDPNLPKGAREAYDKGVKMAGENRPEQAVKHFQQATQVYPSFFLAYVAMGEQLSKLQRDEEAVSAYRTAVAMKPERADGHVGLGVMLVKQQKFSEGIASLRRSLEIDRQSATSYLFLGLAEMMTGELQTAETDLLRAYEIAKLPLAHIYLARLYELRGEFTKAVEHLKAFLKENPNLPEARQAEVNEAIGKLHKKATASKKN